MFSRSQSFQTLNKLFSFLIGKAQICLAVVFVCFAVSVSFTQTTAPIGKLRKQAAKAMKNGDFETAVNNWQEVLRAEPENVEDRLNLSYALYKQRKYMESYDEAMKVNKIDPENARVRALLGSVYLVAGKLGEAGILFRDAWLRNKREPLAFAGSGMLDFYENRTKSGLDKMRLAVELEPDEPDFVFSLAQLAARYENYKEAAEAYSRFLQIAPLNDADRRDRIKGLIELYNYLGNIDSVYRAGGKSQTVVSCEIINNRPVLSVRVNGKKETLRFVLDTGSGMTVVSEDTAKRLRIKPIARGGQARAVGGGGKFPIVYGFLKSLEIGDVRVSNVPVYIRRFNSAGDNYDGYVGISAISKFITTLDYGGKTLSLVKNAENKVTNNEETVIFKKSSFNQNGQVSVPLRTTSSGFLSTEVRIEGVEEPLNFILDTGASVSVVSADAAQRSEISRFAHTTMMRVYGAAGVSENVSTLMLPSLSLGNISRNKILAVVLDLEPVNETTGFQQNGILGGNFLQHFRLKFNFQNSTVTFEPSS